MKDIRPLNLLQSCVRAGVSTADLGYLTTWLMKDYQNIQLIDYISKINEMLDIKFFDSNITIKKIVDHYQEAIEAEISAMEQ